MRSELRIGGVALAAAALVVAGVGIARATGGGSSAGSKPPLRVLSATRNPAAAIAGDESTLVSITPCRIVDTRVTGGVVKAARSFQVSGSTGFAPQGGTSGGCGIPPGATGISANIVATGATQAGFVKAYPTGAAVPSASALDYAAKQTIANGLTLAVHPGTTAGLTVSAATPVQIVVDVTGYYAPEVEAYLYASGASIRSGRISSVSIISTGVYAVNVDSDVTDCAAQATVDAAGGYARAVTSGTTVSVQTWRLDSSAQAVLTTLPVNVTVTC